MEWLTRNRPEPNQLKFYNEAPGVWEIDGFQCASKPFCKSLYPDEAVWKQRQDFLNSILENNRKEQAKIDIAFRLLQDTILH